MAFRLVARVAGQEQRLPLSSGEQLLGSDPDCALPLADPTVSRRHAVVVVDGSDVVLRDLGSRNGIRRGRRRLDAVRLEPGEQVQLGRIPVWLEEVPDGDLEVGMVLDASPHERRQTPAGTTLGGGPVDELVRGRLPSLLGRLVAGCRPEEFAQLMAEALHASLPCLLVEVTGDGGEGMLFRAERKGTSTARRVEASGGGMTIRVDLVDTPSAAALTPLVASAASLLELARRLHRPEITAAKPPADTVAAPDPPSVEPEMNALYADALKVAQGDVSVLILGESGTGKEVLASYIHRASPRAERPFLTLNCASLPQDLLEAELFGIERGVATGVDPRPGKFELADGGTLLLDEIGDMAPPTQAKILRALQSGETYRLGARQARRVDVRIVAATNRDLRRMLAEGSFREDLYHRIATWVVEVPPLRRRVADIPNLAAYFLSRQAARQGLRVRGISRAALDRLQAFRWPGNVRQLEHEMARAVLFLADGEMLDTPRLGEEIRTAAPGTGAGSLRAVLEETERAEIQRALALASAGVEEAARRLGVSRATLYRRMKALGIEG